MESSLHAKQNATSSIATSPVRPYDAKDHSTDLVLNGWRRAFMVRHHSNSARRRLSSEKSEAAHS